MTPTDDMDDAACAKQMLEVAKAMREKSRMAAQAKKHDLAELYGAKAQKLEDSVRTMVRMRQVGV